MNDMGKTTVQNRVEMKKKWTVKSWPSNVTLTQNHVKFIYFRTEKLTSVWDCSRPCCVLHTLYELTSLSHVPPFCNMGKEKKLEVELLDAAQA
jgi:hypothetical protein